MSHALHVTAISQGFLTCSWHVPNMFPTLPDWYWCPTHYTWQQSVKGSWHVPDNAWYWCPTHYTWQRSVHTFHHSLLAHPSLTSSEVSSAKLSIKLADKSSTGSLYVFTCVKHEWYLTPSNGATSLASGSGPTCEDGTSPAISGLCCGVKHSQSVDATSSPSLLPSSC